MRVLIAVVSILVSAAAAMTAAAGDAVLSGWRVVQSVGAVSTVTPGAIKVAVNPQAVLPLGTKIRTGSSGRAILVRGEEQIILDRNSEIVLEGDRSMITRIRQGSGSALFAIGKKRAPHFEVETPYLAALVKGTTFRVDVLRNRSDVAVIEGAVEVSSRDGSAVTLLTAGTTGAVTAQRPKEIEVLQDGGAKRRVTRNEGGWSSTGAAGPGGGDGSGGGPGRGGPPKGGTTGSVDGPGRQSEAFNLSRPEGTGGNNARDTISVADGTKIAGRARIDGAVPSGDQQRFRSRSLSRDNADPTSLDIDDTGRLERSRFSLSKGAQTPKIDVTGDASVGVGGAVGLASPNSTSALKFKPAKQLLDATGRKISLPDASISADDLPSIPILDIFLCALLMLALMIGTHTLALSWRVHRDRAENAALAAKDRVATRQDRILGRR